MTRQLPVWLPRAAIALANGMARQSLYGPLLSELAAHQVCTGLGIVPFAVYSHWVIRRWPLLPL